MRESNKNVYVCVYKCEYNSNIISAFCVHICYNEYAQPLTYTYVRMYVCMYVLHMLRTSTAKW